MTKQDFLKVCRQVGRNPKEFKGDEWKSYLEDRDIRETIDSFADDIKREILRGAR